MRTDFKLIFTILICLLATPLVVSADAKWEIPELNVKLPGLERLQDANCGTDTDGPYCRVDWLAQYLAAIYKLAVNVVGILAVVVMMYGGVLWITAGGNAGKIDNAKSWLAAAATGLVLTLASYTILYQVNPDLVNFGGLRVSIPDSESMVRNNIVEECNDCGEFTIPVSPNSNNMANQVLTVRLAIAYNNSTNKNWRVTEGWPPTANHRNTCHSNGTCVDINTFPQTTDINAVSEIYHSVRDADLRPVYELPIGQSCLPYVDRGVECINVDTSNYSHTFVPHFSVYMR